jgi:hypothetical protein
MSGPTFRTRLAKRVARNPGERLASCGPVPGIVEAEDYVTGPSTDWSTVAESTRGRFRLHSSRDVTNLLPDGVPLDRRDCADGGLQADHPSHAPPAATMPHSTKALAAGTTSVSRGRRRARYTREALAASHAPASRTMPHTQL